MGCYRCLVVLAEREPPREPVAVCRRCGLMTCARDGAVDENYPRFICGVCEIGRVSESGGLPPEPPGPRGGGGGGGEIGPRPDRPPEGPGGGGGAYVDTADFELRKPGLAAASQQHRERWHRDIDQLLPELIELGTNETARALAAEHLGDELGLAHVHETAILLSSQLAAARDNERLKPALLADAFGLGTWVIGAAPDEEPTAAQLAHLPDPRLRLVLGFSALRTGTPA